MKHKLQQLIAMVLAVAMLLCVFPATAFAADTEEEAQTQTPNETNYGFIPVTHPTGRTVTNAYLSGDRETYDLYIGSTKDPLPSTYDSRDYGYVTSVKNQNPYGSCWAHAAMGSLESYMIKHGIPVGNGAAATTSLNLSETQHCWFNYTYAYDAEGMLTGDKSVATYDYDSPSCLDRGGNGEMSAYTLMRWTGAADETVSALQYSRASTVASSGLDSQYAYQYNDCHVQNTEWIPGTDVEAIKNAIMSYGAGNISYYETGNAYTYICTIDNSSQESSSHKWSNHAITIIGWDDTIATSNFAPNKPSNPGAWICKNSWGTGEFDGGYCYISYEDTSVREGYIYFYDAEPIDNYQHNYQYDGSCNVVCYGKGWNDSIDYYEGFANGTKVANVFTAKGAELLKAISFCSWDEALTYTIEIYKNPTTGNPSSGTLMSSQTGTVTFCGYYTIDLNTPVELYEDETFSVVITQSAPTADDNGKYIHTPYDATFNNSSVVSWCSWIHADHGTTSYYQEPNGSWTDCPENGDYRIKAYTDDIPFTITAESNNEAYGTVSVEGKTIYATPAEGYYVSGYEVLSGVATAVINVNTITVKAQSDCTIRIIFSPKPTFTVNYLVSGTYEGNVSAQIYDEITLPATVSVDPEGWTFFGWTTSEFAETTEQPAAYYAPGASYTVLDDVTLYAVYTRVEIGAADIVFELVDAPEDGASFILVSTNTISGSSAYAVGNTIVTSNHYLKAVSVSINDDDTCTASASNLPNVLWKAEGNDSQGYTFYNEAVGKYMGLDSSQFLAPTSTALNWHYTASQAMDNQVDSDGYYYLSYDANNNRYTTSKQEYTIYLFRESNPDLTYYWTNPVVGAHEHTPVYVPEQAPTCGDDGNTAYYRCTICGKYFSDETCEHEIPAASTVIPATGNHSYGEWETVTEPGCMTSGVEKRVCTVCGATETRPVDALGHNPGAPTKENNVDPDCTTAGSYDMVTRCERCNEVLETVHTDVDPLGHDFGDWTETTAPGCTTAGVETRECARCHTTETRPVDALGHSFGDWTQTTPPTCTTAGEETRECARCHTTETRPVDALGHEFGDWTQTTAPTCTTDGEETSTCARCGATETRPVEALGHEWDEGVVTVKPTDSKDGEKLYTCARCQETKTEVLPKLNRDNPFVDVALSDWFYDQVLWAYYHDAQITSGLDENHFGPQNGCTRAQVATFLYAAAGKPTFEMPDASFSDVKETDWYYTPVMWALSKGITAGMGDGVFGANATCTRAQIVTFLYAAADKPTAFELSETSFSDVTENDWFYTPVMWALSKGITAGMGDGSFGASSTCTRAQVVTFLYKAYGVNE